MDAVARAWWTRLLDRAARELRRLPFMVAPNMGAVKRPAANNKLKKREILCQCMPILGDVQIRENRRSGSATSPNIMYYRRVIRQAAVHPPSIVNTDPFTNAAS